MGDFLLDCRAGREGRLGKAAEWLAFCPDMRVDRLEYAEFGLVVSSADDARIWGPYAAPDRSMLVALCGRIALEQREWNEAEKMEGAGGLACKFICARFREEGVTALGKLNGNFAVLVYDQGQSALHLVTDRSGMMVCYSPVSEGKGLVVGSHPDVVAWAAGEDRRLDETSLAQFIMTGCLTFPHSYYERVHALELGSIHTLALGRGQARYLGSNKYFQLKFQVDSRRTERELAQEFAEAVGAAVRRRSLPLFGRTGVALSGGLDSRAILSAAGRGAQLGAFCLFDAPNAEVRAAERIAAACGVSLTLMERDAEFYGRSAELGVRISGGTGSVGSNHFLGARDSLREHGFSNIVTGCYCDYLFKGLAFNTTETRFSRRQELSSFGFQFYRPHFQVSASWREAVQERLRRLFPESRSGRLSEEDWLEVERKRTFPLAYEGDSAQRVIPQRVLPWYLPAADNDLLDVYSRLPANLKLNTRVFRGMLSFLCAESVLRVVDSNTGAPVNASRLRLVFHRYFSALLNRAGKMAKPRLASRGSWPNREFYIHHSPVIRRLWERNGAGSREVLQRILGETDFPADIRDYKGARAQLFMRLLTLKLWLEQRT